MTSDISHMMTYQHFYEKKGDKKKVIVLKSNFENLNPSSKIQNCLIPNITLIFWLS